jgi:hypothetical protein
MGEEEGLLSTQVCDVLGITPQNFNQVVKRNNLMLSTLSLKPRSELVKNGLISKSDYSSRFVPKASVQALVKIVNTPEAWAVYNQLWETLESPAEYVSVQTDVHALLQSSPSLPQ